MRTAWTGSISFGLVNIPVRLVAATRDKDLHFHMLHAKDGARIRFQRVCEVDGHEVPNEEIERGFDLGANRYVTVSDKELQAAVPEHSKTIEIQDFVTLGQIDPMFYVQTYYATPDKNAHKPYHLLAAALQKSQAVGIARMVLRDKERLVAVRASGDVILVSTMHFSDEVTPAAALGDEVPAQRDVDERQLKLAQELIRNQTTDFDPEAYESTYRKRVLDVIERKAEGHKIVVEPERKAKPGKPVDLIAALEASLASVRGRGAPARKVMQRPARRRGTDAPAARPPPMAPKAKRKAKR